MFKYSPRKLRRRVIYAAMILALALPMFGASVAMATPAAPSSNQAPEDTVNFPAGSLIIPVDTTYQNAGMWKVYGLLYNLLQNNIPVSWAIEPTKAYNGIDFTTTAEDARTNVVVNGGNPYDYRGGPFVIAQADVAAAQPFITAWWAANSNQPVVHRATAAFNAEVNIVLRHAPRIAIEQINQNIAIGYMTAAGIPSTNIPGNPGYYLVNQAFINAGGLFQLGTCSSRKFDVYVTPHNEGFSYSLTNPANAGTITYAELDRFVYQGGGWVALCHSISSNENAINDLYRNSDPAVRALFAPLPVTGGFLTVNGLDVANKNQGNNNTWVVDANAVALPVAQVVPTNATITVPSGYLGTWRSPVTGGTTTQYWSQTERVADFTEGAFQYDHTINGVYHDGLGQGKMTFIGGHQHQTTAYNSNPDATFLKAFYNSLFFNGAAVAYLGLFTDPESVNQGVLTDVAIELRNTGASTAMNVQNAIVTLPVGVTYVSTTGPAPSSVSGGGANPTVLTWNTLPDVNAASVALTVNVTVQFFTPGPNQIATLQAQYGDVFGENFTAQACQSIDVSQPPTAVTLSRVSASPAAGVGSLPWLMVVAGAGVALAIGRRRRA